MKLLQLKQFRSLNAKNSGSGTDILPFRMFSRRSTHTWAYFICIDAQEIIRQEKRFGDSYFSKLTDATVEGKTDTMDEPGLPPTNSICIGAKCLIRLKW